MKKTWLIELNWINNEYNKKLRWVSYCWKRMERSNLRGFETESESEIKKPTSYNKEFSRGRYPTAWSGSCQRVCVNIPVRLKVYVVHMK